MLGVFENFGVRLGVCSGGFTDDSEGVPAVTEGLDSFGVAEDLGVAEVFGDGVGGEGELSGAEEGGAAVELSGRRAHSFSLSRVEAGESKVKVLKIADKGESCFGSGDLPGIKEEAEVQETEAAEGEEEEDAAETEAAEPGVSFLENPQEEPDVKEGARSVEGEGRLWKDNEVMRNGDEERRLALVGRVFKMVRGG